MYHIEITDEGGLFAGRIKEIPDILEIGNTYEEAVELCVESIDMLVEMTDDLCKEEHEPYWVDVSKVNG